MKKYLYALIALLVAVPLLFALTGCGSSGGGGGASAKRVAKVEIDTDGNGTANDLQVYVYNSSGALANITMGTVDFVRTKTWSGGNMINETTYTNNAEYPFTSYLYTYTGGVKETRTIRQFNTGTGALTLLIAETYNTNGDVILQWADTDLDEAVTAGDGFVSYTYSFGNLTARQDWTSVDTNSTFDSGTDTLTGNFTYTYNSSGQTLYWDDNDYDEALSAGDGFTSNVYNAAGKKTGTQTWTSGDTNNIYNSGTDTLTNNQLFEWDADGNQIFWYDDNDNDEAFSAGDSLISYVYNAGGKKTDEMRWTSQDTNNIYNSGTDTLTMYKSWVYNADGLATLVWDDIDLDEATSIGDVFYSYAYDADGNQTSYMRWDSGDTNTQYDIGTDTLTANTSTTYDSDGNWLTYYEDSDFSGDINAGDWFEVATYSGGKAATWMAWDSGDTNSTYDAGTDILSEAEIYTANSCDIGDWPENYVGDYDGSGSYEYFLEVTFDSACNETMRSFGFYTSIENYFYNATGIIRAETDSDYSGTVGDNAGDQAVTVTYDATCKDDFASFSEYTEGTGNSSVDADETAGENYTYDADCDEASTTEWLDADGSGGFDAGEETAFWVFSFDFVNGTFLREYDPDAGGSFNMGNGTPDEVTETYAFASEDIVDSITIWTDADGSGDVNAGDTTTGTVLTWSGSQVVNALDWTDANDNGIYNTGEETQLASYDYTGSMINGVIYDLGADGWNDGDMADLYTFTGSRVATYKRWEEAGGDTVYDTNDIGTGINFTYGACGHATRTEWTDADGDAALDTGEETKVETVTCEGGKQTAAPPEDEMWSPVPLPELPSLER